jgi:hypothetical protein
MRRWFFAASSIAIALAARVQREHGIRARIPKLDETVEIADGATAQTQRSARPVARRNRP